MTVTAERRSQIALGQTIRRLRKRVGLRQEDIAGTLGWPQSVVSKGESGERRMDIIELRAIALACGVTLGQLVREFERALSASVNDDS